MHVARSARVEIVHPPLARDRTDDVLGRPAKPGTCSYPPRVVWSGLLHGVVLAAALLFLRSVVLPPGAPEQVPLPVVFEAPAAAPAANPAPAPAAAPAPTPTPPVPTPPSKPAPAEFQPAVVPPKPVQPQPVLQPPVPVPQPPPPDIAPSETAIEMRLPVPPLRPTPPSPRHTVATTRPPTPAAAVAPPTSPVPMQSPASANASSGLASTAAFEPPRPVAGMASDRPPTYPEMARLRGEQGRTVLRVSVGPDGLPRNVSVAISSGFPVLDSAALSAVRNWHFVPATRDNSPVAAIAEVPVLFRLENP